LPRLCDAKLDDSSNMGGNERKAAVPHKSSFATVLRLSITWNRGGASRSSRFFVERSQRIHRRIEVDGVPGLGIEYYRRRPTSPGSCAS
jgi:hypothetical protein